MKNTLFVETGCPFCREAKKAVSLINMRLSQENKIDILYVDNRYDPRNRILRIMNGNGGVLTPTLIIDKPIKVDRFNTHTVTRGRRIIVVGADDVMSYLDRLNTILKGG